jgi:hypothetical protein
MDQVKLNKKHQGADENLRRARDQFKSPKTQKLLSEAILATGATTHDKQRILDQLRKRLRDFKHLGKMASFRPAAIAWVTRQGQLNAALYDLLQTTHNFDSDLLRQSLPTYDGPVDIESLRAWAHHIAQIEANAVASVPQWIEEYCRIVYHGAWSVLKSCSDLGVGSFAPVRVYPDGTTSRLWHPVIEEIAGPVWDWMWSNAFDLATSPVPIAIRLWRKARRQALAWRTSRIQNRRDFVSQTALDAKRNTLEQLMQVEDRGDLTEVEQYLLQRSEDIDIADLAEVYRLFTEAEADGLVANNLTEEDDAEDPEELPMAA